MQMIISLTIVVSAFMVVNLMAAVVPEENQPTNYIGAKFAADIDNLVSENEGQFNYADGEIELTTCNREGIKGLIEGKDSNLLYATVLQCLIHRDEVMDKEIADEKFIYLLGLAMFHDGKPADRKQASVEGALTNVKDFIENGPYVSKYKNQDDEED